MVGKMARPALASSHVRRNLGAFFRTESGIARSAWRALNVVGAVGVTSLVGFHASLFWDRLTDGQLLDPAVALRWTAALLLTAVLVVLRRRGVPLASGRRSLVVWLLVALLHWSAGAAATGSADPTGSASADVTYVLPTTAATALVGLGLLLATLATRRARPALTCLCTAEPCEAGRASSGWRPIGAARAPPLQTA